LWFIIDRITNEVADHVRVSGEHLTRRFKKEIGCGVNEYINRLGIEKAKKLLIVDKTSILSKIMFESGFVDERHFTRMFRRYTGTTPADSRKFSGR